MRPSTSQGFARAGGRRRNRCRGRGARGSRAGHGGARRCSAGSEAAGRRRSRPRQLRRPPPRPRQPPVLDRLAVPGRGRAGPPAGRLALRRRLRWSQAETRAASRSRSGTCPRPVREDYPVRQREREAPPARTPAGLWPLGRNGTVAVGNNRLRSEERANPLIRFRCAGCGYGASRRMAPERCPMCSGTVWDYEARRPLANLREPRP